MVGKTQSLNLHNVKQPMTHQHSDLLERAHTDDSHHSAHPAKKRLPLFASPLDPKATAWIHSKKKTGNLTLGRRPTIAQYEADKISGGIFRKQHEASTLELFFDLFFVANLAVFTANHQHISALSVGNYVGFFAILWSTWFQVSLFDVRFYVDSLFNRFCKLVTFGVFTAFTGLGPVYDVITNGGSTRAFHGIALVLMMSRLMLLLQYASVLWFVRSFKKTMVPLCLMMLVYLASGMVFMGSFLKVADTSSSQEDGRKRVIFWYAVIGVEAMAVIAISSTWRILSFKHTHLVERVGLLTLIIMGEGIIGLTKATAYLLSGTQISVWGIAGKIVAAVTLIYEVYLLYFSPIDHDRFGTIRQQFWTLLHFPLHVAMLLTEEGSAVTLIWNTCMNARKWLRTELPDLNSPSNGFDSTKAFIDKVKLAMNRTETNYHYVKLKTSYDYTKDLDKISNLTAPFGSPEWNKNTSKILSGMFNYTSSFFFENFNFEKPKKAYDEKDPDKKLALYFKAYNVTFTFFFIAAGCLLLILGTMFWIGKKNKTKLEYSSIVLRFVVGIGIPFVCVLAYTEPTEAGFMFTQSGWIIPIVTFAYLFCVIIDNGIDALADFVNRKELRHIGSPQLEKGLNSHHAADIHSPAQEYNPSRHQDDDPDNRRNSNEEEMEYLVPAHDKKGASVEVVPLETIDTSYGYNRQQSPPGLYDPTHPTEVREPHLHQVQFHEPTMVSPGGPMHEGYETVSSHNR